MKTKGEELEAAQPRRTLVVGDVHGCCDELEDLLKAARFTSADQLILAGDLVAKGPDSQGVVQLARERGARAVLGNHDAHVLGALDGQPLKKHHAQVAKSLKKADWAYLQALPVFLDLPELNSTVVHAGLVPGVPLEQQERMLVLNMRSFDLKTGAPTPRIEGGVPWASRWPGPRFVIFGHDAMRGLQRHPHAMGLDSGCVYGKRLSAVWLSPKAPPQLVQVPARQVWQPVDS